MKKRQDGCRTKLFGILLEGIIAGKYDKLTDKKVKSN